MQNIRIFIGYIKNIYEYSNCYMVTIICDITYKVIKLFISTLVY